MPSIDQYERAGRGWPILVECAQAGSTITYGALAARLGLHPRACAFFLGKIQDYCRNRDLPPLQSLAVSKRTGVPGEGYVATQREHMQPVHQTVFAYDWQSLGNPFGASLRAPARRG